MIIPISFNLGATGLKKLPPALARVSHLEVVLVELQGRETLRARWQARRSNRFRRLWGAQRLPSLFTLLLSPQKPATLRIGHHLLEGRVTQLAKPLAVLQRIAGEHSRRRSRGAIALIKRKIVFSKRPTPIVGRPNV
ncbi:hypothetical protein HMN09_01323500 [Mycena chlorophos]|uniref:Uncharacterized protein n=1 Tax=Mycena chlorophos TaxID=658473 RepID=A0A8H6RZM4_MYCCL|nr:hypothetical protein HMN09_01323500 [Mycena chlorophos]